MTISRRKWVTYPFRLTTPAFVGRNLLDDKETHEVSDAEFRVPSLRGDLRFWFRFLAAPLVDHDARRLLEVESLVFGHTEKSSPVTFRLQQPVCRPYEERPAWLPRGGRRKDVRYLLGQGLTGYEKGDGTFLTRSHLAAGTKGVLCVAHKPHHMEPEKLQSVIEPCLWFLQTFGGIGARARRGWGGIAFEELNWDRDPNERDDVVASFHEKLKDLAPNQRLSPSNANAWPIIAPFPSIAGHRWFNLDSPPPSFGSWRQALDYAAEFLWEMRANVPRPTKGDRVTQEYVDIVTPFFDGELEEDAEFSMAGFGLPFVVRSRSRKRTAYVEASLGDEKLRGERLPREKLRRASMLWIRTYESDGEVVPFMHLMQANVLPRGAQLLIREGRTTQALSWDDQDSIDRIIQ